MPLIKNKRYLKHFKKRQIELISPKEFYENWGQIKAKPHIQNLLKDFFLLMFWTGRRPVEILNLKGDDLRRTALKEPNGNYRDYLLINTHTKKGGNDVEIMLVFEQIPQLEQFWERIQGCPADFMYFSLLRTRGKNTLHWKTRPTEDYPNGEPKSKTYDEPTKKIFYWSTKYFGVPAYFFRHNRFSTMVSEGATFQDIKIFKGAKSPNSVEPYISPDKETLRKLGANLK